MTTEATAVEKKQPTKTTKKGTPVSPSELLRIASEMEGSPSDAVAQACGYFTEVTTTATGEVEIRVSAQDESAFWQALLIAQGGIKFAPPARSSRRSGRAQIIKIGKTGNIVVGGRYTSIAGFPFGEGVESKVRVEAEQGKITIFAAPVEGSSSQEMEDDGYAEEEVSDLDL